MNDTQVIIALIAIIRAALDAQGLSDVLILQNYQPTQQGVPEGRVIYIHKLPAVRYGHPQEKNVYNEMDENFTTTHTFIRLASFQVNARVQQDPSDLNTITSSDLVDTVADILQLPTTRQALLNDNIGIERILSVRVLYETNDKDRHEQVPSFDFTLNYRKDYSETVGAVTELRHTIERV